MKKWLAACLLAMALLFVTTAAMAHTKPGSTEECKADKGYTFLAGPGNRTSEWHKMICNACHTQLQENHWAQDGREATCTEKAECGGCSETFGKWGPHDYGDWTPNGNGTHTRTCKRKCTLDDRTKTEACTYQEANCSRPFKCSVCKDEYGEKFPNNHDWEWVSNGDGTHTRTCKNDPSHTETEACSGVGCGQTGTCSVCKGEYTAANHKYETWLYDSNEHWSYCVYCSEERRSSHSFSQYKQSEATCASPAKYLGTCSDCGFYRIYDLGDIDPNNHDLIHHAAKAATCTEIGWKAYDTCSRCDYTTYMELTNGGHNLTHHAAKAATCTEIGWKAYDTCSRCSYTTYVDLPALGHDLIHHAAQAASCTEIGWKAYDTCSRCDYTTYVELPALGHDYQAEIIPRTCEDDGYTLHTCSRCADSYTDTIVPHCGHWYGEWTANGDGVHAAACLRGGCHYEKTVDCEIIELPALNLSLCPVCGTVSDGSKLALASASVKIISGKIPHGEALLRVGTLANGEKLLTVGYVYGGQLSKASCQVKITLPAELLNGCTLSLLNADGTETPVDCTVDGESAVFVLTFAQPTLAVHLVPAQ